jgi:tetratricopeptide (TPR) repeat protein
MEESMAKIEEAVRTLERTRDEAGLAEAYSSLGTLLMWFGRCAEAADVLDRAASLGHRAGVGKVAARSLTWLLVSAFWGPMPVDDALVLCDRVSQGTTDRYTKAYAGIVRGFLLTMADDREQGRALTAEGQRQLEELGQHVNVASSRMAAAREELFAGRPRRADDELRLGYDVLVQMGEKGFRSTTAAMLALTLCAQGRHDEAEPYAREAREFGASDDLTTQLYLRCAEAEILASRREFEEAFRLLEEADDLMDGTDFLVDTAAGLMSRATVEKAAGNRDRARSALEQAVALLEKKGDIAAAAHVRELIDAL